MCTYHLSIQPHQWHTNTYNHCIKAPPLPACSICNEAYRNGWVVTKWISAGVGIYITFAFMAPRLHALGKARGYMTLSQYLHDRFLPPAAGASWVSTAGASAGLAA